jgi:segregation and condensation protein A
MSYRVRLTVFEGPLDLLLQLIQRNELDITQISLALVTDQYLQYIRDLEEVGARELTEFLVIAAQLLLIKSRLLLPSPPAPFSDEEEEDSGQALVERLQAYRRYRAVAEQLQLLEDTGNRAFVRTQPAAFPAPSLPEDAALPEHLVDALRTVLAAKPPAPPVSGVVSQVKITITDQMSLIRELVGCTERCTFQSLCSSASSRVEVIVTFLALLELIRRGEMVVRQERLFGEILIRRKPAQMSMGPEKAAEGSAGGDELGMTEKI